MARIRKNQQDLTAAERQDFIDALVGIKQSGVFDSFVKTHVEFSGRDPRGSRIWYAHQSATFLPWHRKYLIDFENALRTIKPDVTLPYWDWTTARSTTDGLWTDEFLGRNTDPDDPTLVTTGAFSINNGWKISVFDGGDSSPALRRDLGSGGTVTLGTLEQVNAAKQIPSYDAGTYTSTASASDSFRNNIEGWRPGGFELHNRTHVWVGGQMGQMASPNDPAFWMHHCFIDKIWSEWQANWGVDNYQPAQTTGRSLGPTGIMQPFNVTVRSMFDIASMGDNAYTYA